MSLPKPPAFPSLPQFPSFPAAPKPPAAGVPALARGIVEAPRRGWCKAEYYDALTNEPVVFSERPAVVAVAEVRAGDILPVEAPTIRLPEIPKIEIPFRHIPQLPLTMYYCNADVGWWIFTSKCYWAKVALDPDFIPDWFEPHVPRILRAPTECPHGHGAENMVKIDGSDPFAWGDAMAKNSIYWAEQLAPEWKLGPLDLNWVRNKAIELASWMFTSPGRSLGYFASQLQTGTLMTTMQVNDIVKEALETTEIEVDTGLSDFRNQIQTGVNNGLSRVLPTLWSMIGLKEGQLISPVNVRNVNAKSFEFYSLSEGMIVHYLAGGPG